ncbi:hypothetical protein [Streptomyces taklimakanensis]|uniref:hypothetical protein n=1 Tax=Streptomyces taklimakanensis TaxID=2569853 RepID=UPI00192E71A9|nr:hypothetical protein [Streptomyces taklimakanensis]
MTTARNREHRHERAGGRSGRHRERRRGRRRATTRRALRREAPSTVAVVADPAGFAAMRGHTTFPFEDHHTYLRRTEGLLRSLTAQGVHTRVGLFDPAAYARFCTRERIEPDTPDSRARYVAELVATGATVHYRGQPLGRILPLLLDAREHRDTRERATEPPTAPGPRPDCGGDAARGALDEATGITAGLLDGAGPGTHHLVCSVTSPTGGTGPLVAVLRVHDTPRVPFRTDTTQALVFHTVLAAGLTAGRPAAVVMRTTRDGHEEVRGWSLADGRIHPLTEAEVFSAYCTDAETGEPIPPEPGLTYRAGFPLPRLPGPSDTAGTQEPGSGGE